jgi:COMPASS component SWD1
MEFDIKGTALVTNCNDRCIRVIQLHSEEPQSSPSPSSSRSNSPTSPRPSRPPALPRENGVPYFEIQHRFQDLVNRTPWNGCGFSRDGEYIIGGAGHKASHNIYVWDRAGGGLMKILEGPKDPLEDLDVSFYTTAVRNGVILNTRRIRVRNSGIRFDRSLHPFLR